MPTLSQLAKKGRHKKIKKVKATGLRRIFNAKIRRYKNIEAHESAWDRQSHLDHIKNPPKIRRTKVFLWEKYINDE